MVIRWKDYSPEPPFRIYAMHDLNRTLGHFKTLTEAKEAAEKWFRQELLDLDF
jgi:hypothetical protein